MTPAQEARLLELPASSKVTTITGSDLLFLLPPTSAARRNGLILFELVKMVAAGRRRVIIRDETLWERLGWSESTLRRAKRALIEAGLPVRYRRVRGEPAPSEWRLDRRLVPALLERDREWEERSSRTLVLTPGGVNSDSIYAEENAPEERFTTFTAPSGAVLGRASPPGRTAKGLTTPDAELLTADVSEAPPPGEPAAALEQAGRLLRQWLDERCELRSEEGRAAALSLLPDAVRWASRALSRRGESVFAAHAAGALLASELGSAGGVS